MKICLHCKYIFSLDEWSCPSCGHQPEHLNGIVAHDPEFAKDGGGFKPEYFSELSQLEAENFWFRARNQFILWALRTYKPDASNFLEVGCGNSFVLSGVARACPKLALSGTEIFLADLSHAAERVPSAHFMQMDARRCLLWKSLTPLAPSMFWNTLKRMKQSWLNFIAPSSLVVFCCLHFLSIPGCGAFLMCKPATSDGTSVPRSSRRF